MLPLYDSTRSHSRPWVNYMLILACVGLFLLEIMLPERGLLAIVETFGIVPLRVRQDLAAGDAAAAGWPFVTSMFLHGGWLHLVGNMLFLHIFGDNVEDRMGHLRYLLFYLVCGVGAGLGHVLSAPESTVPTIGASGAIAGVLGAYLVLFPHAKVTTLATLGFFWTTLQIPALFFLGAWFVFQFLEGMHESTMGGGVAYWAHVGGFALGLLLVKLFDRGPREVGVWRSRS